MKCSWFMKKTYIEFLRIWVGLNSTLQNRLVRWGIPPTYKHFFKPYHIRCGALNTPSHPWPDNNRWASGSLLSSSNIILKIGLSLTQSYKAKMWGEGFIPYMNIFLDHIIFDVKLSKEFTLISSLVVKTTCT